MLKNLTKHLQKCYAFSLFNQILALEKFLCKGSNHPLPYPTGECSAAVPYLFIFFVAAKSRELVHLEHGNICRSLLNGIRPNRRTAHKTGCETWTCVWSPDQGYLAWSSGHRMVHLIPWNKHTQKK